MKPSCSAVISRAALLLVLAAVAPGCSRFYQKGRTLGDKPAVVAVDAKLRYLTYSEHGDTTRRIPRFCLEPSPDVFSAVSATFAGKGKYKDAVAAEVSSAIAETAATIGVRTQTIELLRDAMYRICELTRNGSMDNETAEDLHREYQRSMVTLAAVSALADAARPQQIILGGRTSMTSGQVQREVGKALDAAKKDRPAKEQGVEQAEAALKTAVGKVCDTLVKESTCTVGGAPTWAKCELQGADKALCLVGGGTALPEEGKRERVESFCKDRKVEDVPDCGVYSDARDAKETEDEALADLDASIAKLEAELQTLEANWDLKAEAQGTAVVPAACNPSSPNVKEVADVVGKMVTQVYGNEHIRRCVDILGEVPSVQTLGRVSLRMTEKNTTGILSAERARDPRLDADVAAIEDEYPGILQKNTAELAKLAQREQARLGDLVELCKSIASAFRELGLVR